LAERDLATLFLAHRRELEVYLARQVQCPDTVADLLQETFARVAREGIGPGVHNARAYLYRTARNLVIDHVRREERRQTRPLPPAVLADLPDSAVPADRALEARQRLERLSAAMEELPQRTREVFQLNRVEGLTYGEVAECLGISESSVQKHLARALLHAMQFLKSL
jgi:RNA polymerase sigma factor (sigma-70 family)